MGAFVESLRGDVLCLREDEGVLLREFVEESVEFRLVEGETGVQQHLKSQPAYYFDSVGAEEEESLGILVGFAMFLLYLL